ncbi:MAG: Ig-like domain-containing protein, partial [Gammaproteobacteria bacterium]|nr:Ig-like domain-containing protein [Gammaproteobacteria bacterium]
PSLSADTYTRITSPANGASFIPGARVSVSVDARDPDGIEVARLWVNNAYYALDNTAPYTFTVSGLATGTHTLMVRTKDRKGNLLDSTPITISVQDPKPYANITSPANGTAFKAGETFTVRANAFDPDGVEAVRLWINGMYHSLDSSAPYEFPVSALPAGNHTLFVRSKDAKGNLLDSAPVSISIAGSGSNTGGGSGGGGGASTVTLPIEVLGPAGTKKTISFDINDPTNISHLYLRCNACGYHDIDLDKNTAKTKATVRVNGGTAIPLKHFIENGRVYGNTQIRIIGGEASYGGIGGAFRTVRMTVPVSGLKKGTNTLTFEHLNAEAPSIGFRILELNLLQNGDLARKVLNDRD